MIAFRRLPAGDEFHTAWEAGRRAYPSIEVPQATFDAFSRARQGAAERAADLYLACACANGIAGAAEVFLDTYGNRMRAYLGRIACGEDDVDEVRQRVLVRCLIGDDAHPAAIASYSGRGSLEGWVRATAVREGLALARQHARHVELSDSLLEHRGSVDRTWLVAHYREPVIQAFTAATTGLPREQRTLLRLHYVYGLTTAELAKMLRISRATLVRRMTDARDALMRRLASELNGRTGIEPDDCAQVLRMLKGKLDLRLSSLLRETAA